MDLNYLNVANYVSSRVKVYENVFELDLDLGDTDSYAIIYLTVLQYYYNNKLNYQITLKSNFSPYNPNLINLVQFDHFYFGNGKSNLRLANTYIISTKSGIDKNTHEIVDSFEELVRRNKLNLELSEIKKSLAEIIDNIHSHSGETYYFMRCDYYQNKNFLDIAIGDIGYGIRTTLGRKLEYSEILQQPHFKAIELAFKKGITCKSEIRGDGLYDIDMIFKRLDDVFFMSSGDGYYRIDSNLPTCSKRAGNLKFKLPGVQALLRFRCT